jgi:hypothetical protein
MFHGPRGSDNPEPFNDKLDITRIDDASNLSAHAMNIAELLMPGTTPNNTDGNVNNVQAKRISAKSIDRLRGFRKSIQPLHRQHRTNPCSRAVKTWPAM